MYTTLKKCFRRGKINFKKILTVWNPWTKADFDVLEIVQLRAISFVSGLKGSTYEEILNIPIWKMENY